MAERIIVLCVATIAELFGMLIELILANAKNVSNALHELGAYALAREPSPQCGSAVMVDLGSVSEARIHVLFTKPSPRDDAARSVPLARVARQSLGQRKL
jgi:hypothetical protein